MVLLAVLLFIAGGVALVNGWIILGVVLIGLGMLLLLIRIGGGEAAAGVADAIGDIDFD